MSVGTDRSSLNRLLDNLDNQDPDFRYMSLNDLQTLLKAPSSSWIHGEPHTAKRLIEGLIKALQDQNGEVQNKALQWYDTRRSPQNGEKLT